MEPLSACIIVRNEEHNIRDCLESVRWVDEIVVVDAFSEDRTVSICQEYTDRVLQRAWTGFYDQVCFAVESCRSQWVLYIEADERLSPALIEEIQREFSVDPVPWEGFSLTRLTYFLGRWIRHGTWYPDRLNRIFRKERFGLGGAEPHLQMRVNGRVKRLRGDLLHYTGRDLSWFLRKMDHYTASVARTKKKKGKEFRWWDLMVRPPVRFMKSYFLKAGFLDGKQGFVIAVLSAFYVFTKYLKLWELEQQEEWNKKGRVRLEVRP